MRFSSAERLAWSHKELGATPGIITGRRRPIRRPELFLDPAPARARLLPALVHPWKFPIEERINGRPDRSLTNQLIQLALFRRLQDGAAVRESNHEILPYGLEHLTYCFSSSHGGVTVGVFELLVSSGQPHRTRTRKTKLILDQTVQDLLLGLPWQRDFLMRACESNFAAEHLVREAKKTERRSHSLVDRLWVHPRFDPLEHPQTILKRLGRMLLAVLNHPLLPLLECDDFGHHFLAGPARADPAFFSGPHGLHDTSRSVSPRASRISCDRSPCLRDPDEFVSAMSLLRLFAGVVLGNSPCNPLLDNGRIRLLSLVDKPVFRPLPHLKSDEVADVLQVA